MRQLLKKCTVVKQGSLLQVQPEAANAWGVCQGLFLDGASVA